MIGVQRNRFKGLASKEWARYRLQGHLSAGRLRTVLDKPALDSFREAISLLREMPSWSRLLASRYTREPECCGETNTHARWLHDRASIAVCEAVVYHHGAVSISEILTSHYCPNDSMQRQSYFSTMDPRFWTFTAACTIGDAQLARETIEALHQGSRITKDEFANYLTKSLYLPAILGRTHIVQLLLDLGANPNFVGKCGVSKNKTALSLAAFKGKSDVVQLLLHPKYQLQCTGWKYEKAIINAASFPHVEVRRKLVPLLLTLGHNFHQPALRSSLFDAACIVNDTTLAKSILADGPVEMFDAFSESGWGDNALVTAATNGHLESVQLILQSDFVSAAADVKYNVYWMALRAASRANSIAIFQEILPYIKQSRSREAFILAAAVDGGYSAMEILLPRIDLKARFQGNTVGEAGIFQALVHLWPENARFLLQQGVCVKRHIRVSQTEYKRDINAFNVIQDLLRGHKLPQLEIR